MATKNIDKVDLLLSKLDRKQLADFIRKECCGNKQFQDRFLALGAGTLFRGCLIMNVNIREPI